MTAIAGATAVIGGIGTISQGSTQAGLYGQQAQMYRDAAENEKLDALHAHEDLAIQRDRTLSTSRAVMGAQGGGEDTGILSAEGAQFGAQDQRITNTSGNKLRQIYARANLSDATGSAVQSASLFRGLGQMALGGYNLFSAGQMKKWW